MDPSQVIAHGIDLAQYPLIGIILIVVFYAQKVTREDRDKSDQRAEKLNDRLTALAEKSNTVTLNNTQAMRDLERVIEQKLNNGNGGYPK